MNRRLLFFLVILAVAAAATIWGTAHWRRQAQDRHALSLYGTADIREVQLAFRVADRIAELLVEEGDAVQPGQTLAKLDTSILEAELERAQAAAESQRQVVNRLVNGSRPQEIERARGLVEEATALLHDVQQRYEDTKAAYEKQAATQWELDDALAAVQKAQGRLKALKAELSLALEGPRQEDIAAAKALLREKEAAVELAKTRLNDAQLVAPAAGIIRERILEPGDMADPTRPVFTLAKTDPLWIRVYIDEPDLGLVQLGMNAVITTDSYPGRTFTGWVGYISPTAEFTPKFVHSPRVRTQLVYEARVFVHNPDGAFRLGMPATVTIPLDQHPTNHAPSAASPDRAPSTSSSTSASPPASPPSEQRR